MKTRRIDITISLSELVHNVAGWWQYGRNSAHRLGGRRDICYSGESEGVGHFVI
jgi:hypothetical protein